MLARVTLRPRMARPFFARHPWVFAGSIGRVEGDPPPGAEVGVFSHEGLFVARGLFNPDSAIRVRLYRWDDAPLDDAFWRSRVEGAVSLRSDILGRDDPVGATRLVSSEADGLSGLTVDRYGRQLVALFTGRGLFERRETLIEALVDASKVGNVVARTDKAIAAQEHLELFDEVVRGEVPEGPVEVVENGLKFGVRLRSGQKTGFYLDQRDNRRAVADYARGRRVLDLFCYTGGFALNALAGGATHALGVDSSAPAIDDARANAVRNGRAHARFEAADVFAALEKMKAAGERFGLVVVDPPKFAQNARGVDEAMKRYLRLNRAAVEVLEPGGILATCSCSGSVDRGMFLGMLGQVAELSGRPIQILEVRGASADHPVSASCPEGEYLKCMICRI